MQQQAPYIPALHNTAPHGGLILQPLCMYRRLQENRADIWDNANALAVVVGGTSDDLRYLKSISLHLWLFGYELPGELLLLLLLLLMLLMPCAHLQLPACCLSGQRMM